MMSTPRRLTASDAAKYAALRAEMLTDSPWAFGSSPGQDRMGSVEAVRTWLETAEGAILAVPEQDGPEARLIAAAGVMREAAIKRRHIAGIWGVFVAPAWRGRGLGRAVVAAAVDVARAWPDVDIIQLSVSDHSPEARAIYESLGFVAWGVEPDCLRIDGRGYAEVHMALRLRTSSAR